MDDRFSRAVVTEGAGNIGIWRRPGVLGDSGTAILFIGSSSWVAGTNPDRTTLFHNNTGIALDIKAVTFIAEIANGSAANVNVVRATEGQALSAGTVLATFNTLSTVGQAQTTTPAAVSLPVGSRLGLTAPTGTFDTSQASVTVMLAQG